MAQNKTKPMCESCGFELTKEELEGLNPHLCRICVSLERAVYAFEKALNCKTRENTIVEVGFKVKRYTDYNI